MTLNQNLRQNHAASGNQSYLVISSHIYPLSVTLSHTWSYQVTDSHYWPCSVILIDNQYTTYYLYAIFNTCSYSVTASSKICAIDKGHTRSYWVILSFTGSYSAILGHTRSYPVIVAPNQSQAVIRHALLTRVILRHTQSYWVMLSHTFIPHVLL